MGSGSGYLTCVLAALVMPGGCVVGVEHIEALREMGEGNARKGEVSRGWVESGSVRFVKGDGRLGWREGAPWDAIVSWVLLLLFQIAGLACRMVVLICLSMLEPRRRDSSRNLWIS